MNMLCLHGCIGFMTEVTGDRRALIGRRGWWEGWDNWWWSTRFDCCYWCRIRAGTSSKKQVIETKTWNLNWWERDLGWKVCVHCRLLEPSSLPLWKAMQEVVMNGHDDYDDGLLAYSCFAGGVWQCKQIGSWLNKKKWWELDAILTTCFLTVYNLTISSKICSEMVLLVLSYLTWMVLSDLTFYPVPMRTISPLNLDLSVLVILVLDLKLWYVFMAWTKYELSSNLEIIFIFIVLTSVLHVPFLLRNLTLVYLITSSIKLGKYIHLHALVIIM